MRRPLEDILHDIDHSDETIRDTAIVGLSELRSEAVPDLIARLSSDDDHEKALAALALICLPDPGARPHLAKLLDNEPSDVVWAAAKALETINEPNLHGQKLSERVVYYQSFFGVEGLTDFAEIPIVLAYVSMWSRSDDPLLRKAAATILGASVFSNVLPPEYRATLTDILLLLLEDSSDAIRRRAAESLGCAGAPKAVWPLVRHLVDVSPDVRQEVKRTLSYYGESAIPYMVQFAAGSHFAEFVIPGLPHEDAVALAESRVDIADLLGQIQSPDAEAMLVNALQDHDERVRAMALRGLARTENKKYLENFLTALREGTDAEAEVAASAVQRLRAKKAVEPLIRRLERNDDNAEVANGSLKSAIIKALREIGTPTAMTAVKNWESRSQPGVR